MAAHSSVLAWRIPGMRKPGGLPSLGSHRVRNDWSDLAAAALVVYFIHNSSSIYTSISISFLFSSYWKKIHESIQFGEMSLLVYISWRYFYEIVNILWYFTKQFSANSHTLPKHAVMSNLRSFSPGRCIAAAPICSCSRCACGSHPWRLLVCPKQTMIAASAPTWDTDIKKYLCSEQPLPLLCDEHAEGEFFLTNLALWISVCKLIKDSHHGLWTAHFSFSCLESLAILQMNCSKQQEWLIGDAEEMALPQSNYLKEMEIFACFCDSC